jgi:hypothetical protein
MNGLRALAWALALFVLSGVGRAQGQSLALSSATTTFPNAGVAQLNTGGVEDAGLSVSVDPGGSSTGWTLYLRANNATLSPGGKPVSDLLWRLDGSTTWTALGTIDQPIASGTGPATVKVHLRALLRWAADGPGNYGTDVTYSLTTS